VCDIACGIRLDDDQNPVLAAFAKKVNASYIEQWADLGLYDEHVATFALAFQQVVSRTIAKGGRIHFNLARLDVPEALAGDPDDWMGRYTAWELQQVVRNPEWLAKTTFYQNDAVLNDQALTALGIIRH
jgi:hypothetical protein